MKGFTLIEILLALTLGVILLTLGITSYQSLEREVKLDMVVDQIVSMMRLARNKTIASEEASRYGVHLESNRTVLFKGATYSAGALANDTYNLPVGVEISNINVGADSDVVFERLSGTTGDSGDITIRLVSYPKKTLIINILPAGQIGLAGTVVSTDSRITDSRHLHFDLGWSIQGAASAALYFTDPLAFNVQEDINMLGYFSLDGTEFDWSGTVDVNGSIQTLRIHTHYLDAFDTNLCIHRDGRYNDKALNISIDGKDIVSYTADGTATVGSFGGTMEQQ